MKCSYTFTLPAVSRRSHFVNSGVVSSTGRGALTDCVMKPAVSVVSCENISRLSTAIVSHAPKIPQRNPTRNVLKFCDIVKTKKNKKLI